MSKTRVPLPKADLRRKRFAEVLQSPVAQLNLPVRTVNFLEDDGVLLVEDLLNCTRERLLAIPNFGDKALEQVFNALRDVGLACTVEADGRGRWSYVGPV
ncbi:MAG: DNA-directed RNA polymerase subunit alpha [Pirellulaceae bacterium]|jgi:DNA-directed RNA polymerase alpha subunit|nr:DNA-directed RNA polymerase subunit alpha C-terminal domain-containing protein [Thermoguttaceae bacterium]MDI9445566.1 DNA-directed RNA polymerase subunit alpha C-terminal domain-containing protein [Planctomycetota bacterium]NLZ01664.1 DNA-directed RNA polymerase subunit alpha [Pirellulaceae bacterium]